MCMSLVLSLLTSGPKDDCVCGHWTSLSSFPVWSHWTNLPFLLPTIDMTLLIGLLRMAWSTGCDSWVREQSHPRICGLAFRLMWTGTLSPLSPEEKDSWEIWLMSSCSTTALQNINLVENRKEEVGDTCPSKEEETHPEKARRRGAAMEAEKTHLLKEVGTQTCPPTETWEATNRKGEEGKTQPSQEGKLGDRDAREDALSPRPEGESAALTTRLEDDPITMFPPPTALTRQCVFPPPTALTPHSVFPPPTALSGQSVFPPPTALTSHSVFPPPNALFLHCGSLSNGISLSPCNSFSFFIGVHLSSPSP